MSDSPAGALPKHHKVTSSESLVIGASSAGTILNGTTFICTARLLRKSASTSSPASMRPPALFSHLQHFPLASRCVHSGR